MAVSAPSGLRHVAGNGFVLLLPVLLWNLFLTRKLPGIFAAASFHRDIPAAIRVPENILRTLLLLMPCLGALGGVAEHRSGYLLYLAGVAAYFLSWLLLIGYPRSQWGRSLAGRVAPALTPGVWLAGMGLVLTPYGESWTWLRPIYFGVTVSFLAAHSAHVWWVHQRESARGDNGRASSGREG